MILNTRNRDLQKLEKAAEHRMRVSFYLALIETLEVSSCPSQASLPGCQWAIYCWVKIQSQVLSLKKLHLAWPSSKGEGRGRFLPTAKSYSLSHTGATGICRSRAQASTCLMTGSVSGANSALNSSPAFSISSCSQPLLWLRSLTTLKSIDNVYGYIHKNRTFKMQSWISMLWSSIIPLTPTLQATANNAIDRHDFWSVLQYHVPLAKRIINLKAVSREAGHWFCQYTALELWGQGSTYLSWGKLSSTSMPKMKQGSGLGAPQECRFMASRTSILNRDWWSLSEAILCLCSLANTGLISQLV